MFQWFQINIVILKELNQPLKYYLFMPAYAKKDNYEV